MTFFVGDLRNALPAALNATSSSTSRAEQRKPSAGAVPVLVLVPVQQAGQAASVSALQTLQTLQTLQQGDGLHTALPRLLGVTAVSAMSATTMTTAMATGSVSTVQHREGLGLQDARTRLLTANVILQHQLRQQQQQQLLQPARREASLSSSPASSTSSSSRSSRSSALSATSPPFVPHAVHAVHSTATDTDTDSMRAEDLSQTLPSFGARTAAAKQLLSAAPGGPVFGHRSTSGHSGLDNSPLDSALCQKKKFKKVFCPFCKKNGERKETYTAHGLNERSPDGSIRVICPVLRSLRCEICGSTGDRAHTRTHCPMGMSLLPVATILKSTQRRCDGSKRSFL